MWEKKTILQNIPFVKSAAVNGSSQKIIVLASPNILVETFLSALA